MPDENLYFPDEGYWDKVEPSAAGWDLDGLNEVLCFAEQNRSTGLVMLHRGRLMCEWYWGLEKIDGSSYETGLKGYDADGSPIEDVASIQKSFGAIMACIARAKGLRQQRENWRDLGS